MSLFGSSASTSTTNTTTNTSTSNTTTGDIGLTGSSFLNALQEITGLANNTIQSGYELSSGMSASVSGSLADIVNAGRDFAQRAIAGSTGQSTPVQRLESAGSGNNSMLILLGVGVLALFILKG